MRFVFIGTAAGFHFQTTELSTFIWLETMLCNLSCFELLWFSHQIKEQVPSHLKRENIQFKEVKEQRKNLVTLNPNTKTIASQIVNHSLARMLVEKFCSNTIHKNLLKFIGLLWKNTVVKFFIMKLPISIHFFSF